MAGRYKDYNNVIYEICNEPNNCSWQDIKNYAMEVIPAIRAKDRDAIIIVGTPTWSQLGSAGHLYEPVDDPITGYGNLMYAFHFYASDPAHNQLYQSSDFQRQAAMVMWISAGHRNG